MESGKNNKYSIIIPVFNSENTLIELANTLCNELKALAINYELIFVDDCSTDNSWGILKQLRSDNESINLIRLGKNTGPLTAGFCGAKKAIGDIIITYDDDMQYPVSEISNLIRNFHEKKCLLLYGVPVKRKYSLKTKIYSLVFKFVISNTVMKNYVPKGFFFSSFRIFTRTFFNGFSMNSKQLRHFDIYAMWTLDPRYISFAEVNHSARKSGRSGQTFSKKMNDAIHNWLCLFYDYKSLPVILTTILFLLIPVIIAMYFLVPVLYLMIMVLLLIAIGLLAYILIYVSRLYVQKNGHREYFIIEEQFKSGDNE